MKYRNLFAKHFDRAEFNRLVNVLVDQLDIPEADAKAAKKAARQEAEKVLGNEVSESKLPDLTVFDRQKLVENVEKSVDAFLDNRNLPAERDVAIVRLLLRYFFDHFFDDEESFRISGNELFYIFMTSAAFGSLVETLWCRISNGFWERRTSVIYGDLSFAEAIGGVFLTLILRNDLKAPVEDIFAKGAFWGTVLEYIMSWGEETFTGYRSWDYSSRFLNINGRVCAMYSGFWGLLGVLWCKLIYPVLKVVYDKVPDRAKKALFWSILPVVLGDIAISIIAKNRFSDRRAGMPTENAFDEWVDQHFPDEMVINAYPNSIKMDKDGNMESDTLNSTNAHALEEDTLKAKLKARDAASTEKREELTEALKAKSSELLENISEDVKEKAASASAQLQEAAQDKADELKEKAADQLQAAAENISEAVAEKREAVRLTAKERAKQVMGIITSMFIPGIEHH